jgi:very-short-patch-repair endonuclease
MGSEIRWRTPPELWEKLKPIARQMRRYSTSAENRLWQRLRNRQILGFRFRRQHPLDRFILDFYCSEAQLAIEIDGPVHRYTQQEDLVRQQFLKTQGLQMLRFTNEEVHNSLDSVLEQIAAALSEKAYVEEQ